MNYTNGSARGHVTHERPGHPVEGVLSLEMTRHGLRLCVRKPATLSRRSQGKRKTGRAART